MENEQDQYLNLSEGEESEEDEKPEEQDKQVQEASGVGLPNMDLSMPKLEMQMPTMPFCAI